MVSSFQNHSHRLLSEGEWNFSAALPCKKHTGIQKVVIGYRSEPFTDEFIESGAELYIATEDGCKGTKGNVIDCIRENKISGDIYFACGPMPMLRGLKEYTLDSGSETQLSLEERMACGIGVCLGCVVRSVSLDDHSHVNNKESMQGWSCF